MNIRAHLLVLVIATLVTTAVAGCGEDDVRPRPVVDPPTDSPTADAASSDPATVSFNGRTGTAKVTIRVGAAQAAEAVDDPGAAACAKFLARTGQDEGAMAIPVTVTGKVTTGGPGPLVAQIGSLYEVVGGEVNDLGFSGVMFGVKYRDFAPQCDRDADAGAVRWENGSGSWSTWIVVPASSTSSGGHGSVLISPGVSLGSGFGGGSTELSGGDASPVVRCGQATDGELPPAYVALDRDFALETGCVTSGGAQSTPITDRFCHAAYPNGGSTSDGDIMTYDREGSLGQVCNGFGLENGRVTAGMRCALIASAAVFSKTTTAPINRLCDAREVVEAFETGSWVGAAKTLACGAFGSLFAEAAGLAAAARFANPAVGVNTYRAMAAGVPVACEGISGGGAGSLGEYLVSRHHANVRNAILRDGKCLQIDTSSSDFSAADCP